MKEQEVRIDGILCCKVILSPDGKYITEFKNGKRIVSIIVEDYLHEIQNACETLSSNK